MRITHALAARRVAGVTIASLATLACPAIADDAAPDIHWYSRFAHTVEAVWQTGQPEIYLPVHSHHRRSAYSQEHIRAFNETPFGLGIGKGIVDANGHWHGLYALMFQDSHAKPEYVVGYSYKARWQLASETRLGLGFTALVTARSDIGRYAPFPLPLPILSLEHRNVSIEANYVPGGKGAGNVYFIYAKTGF